MTEPRKSPVKKAEIRPKFDEDEVLEGAPKMETPEDPSPPPARDERVAPPADEEEPQPPPLDTGTGSPMARRPDVFRPPEPDVL